MLRRHNTEAQEEVHIDSKYDEWTTSATSGEAHHTWFCKFNFPLHTFPDGTEEVPEILDLQVYYMWIVYDTTWIYHPFYELGRDMNKLTAIAQWYYDQSTLTNFSHNAHQLNSVVKQDTRIWPALQAQQAADGYWMPEAHTETENKIVPFTLPHRQLYFGYTLHYNNPTVTTHQIRVLTQVKWRKVYTGQPNETRLRKRKTAIDS